MAREATRRVDGERTLLISIKPCHAENILTGKKSVELRRLRPHVQEGDLMIIYATAPTSAVLGTARIRSVVQGNPHRLWRMVGKYSGIRYAEFRNYFSGSAKACGIHLTNAKRSKKPVKLTELRKVAPGFHPPQSFKYLRRDRSSDHSILERLQSL